MGLRKDLKQLITEINFRQPFTTERISNILKDNPKKEKSISPTKPIELEKSDVEKLQKCIKDTNARVTKLETQVFKLEFILDEINRLSNKDKP